MNFFESGFVTVEVFTFLSLRNVIGFSPFFQSLLHIVGQIKQAIICLAVIFPIRQKNWPEAEILGVQSSFDDAGEVEKIVTEAMERTPDLAGIFVASAGQEGVWKAFDRLGIGVRERPHVIIYDLTRENVQALRDGSVDFLIDQEAYVQGNYPPKLLYDLLVRGRQPDEEFLFTDINIKTKYNL